MCNNFFKKKLVQKKLFALLTKEKQPKINGKLLTPPFFHLFTVYVKN